MMLRENELNLELKLLHLKEYPNPLYGVRVSGGLSPSLGTPASALENVSRARASGRDFLYFLVLLYFLILLYFSFIF